MDTSSHPSCTTSQPQIRAPLSARNNASSPVSVRWAFKDSDESEPSQHGSIFDASYVPYESMVTMARNVSPVLIKRPPPNQPSKISVEDLKSESPLSRLGVSPFLYGHGTELHPIAEQRSIATLRTASYSTSDLSSVMLQSSDSHPRAENTRPGKDRLRRKQSFSLDDLGHIGRRQTAKPQGRILEPIFSFSTPIGSESYTPAQDLHRYPYSPPYSPPAAERPLPDHLADSGVNDPTHSFRPPRSGYGKLSAHPWVRLVQNSPSGAGSGRDQSYQMDPTRLSSPARPNSSRRTLRGGDSYSNSGNRNNNPRGATQRRGAASPRRNDPTADTSGGTSSWTCERCHRPADEQWSL